ncbi:MAG: tetraacyldisaccharide 4'-kinase, partial [Bacteroidales bacterium]|nr:tetraacyldisaccharide 4'-kinase [Bacteroidales bacterium]
MIYRLILSLRNARYKGGRHSVKAPVPTICVGNITVGGTGKTPHCEMILRLLLDSARWGSRNIALLSRGYKRRSKGFQEVLYNGSAAMFGDEPLQIKRKFPPVVTAVCKD